MLIQLDFNRVLSLIARTTRALVVIQELIALQELRLRSYVYGFLNHKDTDVTTALGGGGATLKTNGGHNAAYARRGTFTDSRLQVPVQCIYRTKFVAHEGKKEEWET